MASLIFRCLLSCSVLTVALFAIDTPCIAAGRNGLVDSGEIRFANLNAKGESTYYTINDLLPRDQVRALCKGRDGGLWIGTGAGLARLKDGRLTVYIRKDDLSLHTVKAFYKTNQGSPGTGLEGGESNRFADWKSFDLPNYQYLLSLSFYHISWFYLLCAVVMAGAGWAGYQMSIARSDSLYSAVQAERSRIAREMHDTLIQGVIGSMALLTAVSKTLEVSPQQARNYLEMARSELSKSLNDLRDAVISLREQMRETKSLVDEIHEMMQRLTAGSPVHSRCEVYGEPRPLPNPIAENLIRIGREAIANAVRHAAADHLLVELRFALNWVELRMRDDGVGFDVESSAADGNSHFGLLGMRERAAAIEGELILDSRPGQGTEIAIRVMFD